MRLGSRILVILCLLGTATVAHAHNFETAFVGGYAAVGPTVGTMGIAGERAPHVGVELSVGYNSEVLGFGVWGDYQHGFGALDQERIGVGGQLLTPILPIFGVDFGYLAVLDTGAWAHGVRARAFLTMGWVTVAGGGGFLSRLGAFNEFTLLLKVPFSPDISCTAISGC